MRLLFILLLSISLFACGSGKKSLIPENIPADKPKVTNALSLKKVWSRSIGKKFNDDSEGFVIKTQDDILYVASQNGIISAIDTSGKQLWKVKSKTPLSAGVGIGEGLVLVADVNGKVHAYLMEDGKLFWQQQVSSEVLTAPAISNGVVVVRSVDGKVAALEAKTGDIRWTIQRDLPRLSLRGESQPLLVQNVAVVGFPSGNLLAVRLEDGGVIWDVPVSTPQGSNEIERLVDVFSQPLLIDQLLIANTFQGNIIALDIPTRQLRWRTEMSSYQNLSSDRLLVYLTDENANITALDATTGNEVWSKDYLRYRSVSNPSIIGSYLLVFGNDKDLYLIDKSAGELAGSYPFSAGRVLGNPVVDGNRFYILTSKGDLQAFELGQ
ncbi:MAG: outer membrane protein assembly factor BamB [Arenicella sp.]